MKTHKRLWAFTVLMALIVACILPMTAKAAPAELFFSEYIEGTSNNKALEIFNGTGGTVDLGAGGYSIQMYFNGSSAPGLTINLTGTVANGDVYVVGHSSAAAQILAQADQTSGAGWFNGNDAVVLRKGTTVIDSIGQVGVDPGTSWGSGMTANHTLVRNPGITSGDTNSGDAFDPSAQWTAYPENTYDYLGSHSVTTYTVTFDVGAHGTLASGDLVQSVYPGDPAVEPTVTPETGYDFIGWDTDTSSVTSDLTVTAQYRIQTCKVTFLEGAHGAFDPAGADAIQTVDYGGAAAAPTVIADTGYEFTGWDKSFDHVTCDLTVTAQYAKVVIEPTAPLGPVQTVEPTQTTEPAKTPEPTVAATETVPEETAPKAPVLPVTGEDPLDWMLAVGILSMAVGAVLLFAYRKGKNI